MLGKHKISSTKCSDKPQPARKAIILDTKLGILEHQGAVEGDGAENDTQHSCISPVVDTFCDFENSIQKNVDNDSNWKRSLELEYAIQNNCCLQTVESRKNVTSLTIKNDIIFQANDHYVVSNTDASSAATAMMTMKTEPVKNTYFTMIQEHYFFL